MRNKASARPPAWPSRRPRAKKNGPTGIALPASAPQAKVACPSFNRLRCCSR